MDEKKWRKGYKVVRRQGSRYVSAFAPPGSGMKVYSTEKSTKRTPGYIKGKIRDYGPLAVSDSLKGALRGMRMGVIGVDLVAFSCLYIPSQDKDYWHPGYERRNIYKGGYWRSDEFAEEVKIVAEVASVTWDIKQEVKP